MNTSSPKTPDPMLVCPAWCDLHSHDQVEQLRYLSHSRDVLDLTVPAAHPVGEEGLTTVAVSVSKSGYRAAPVIRLGVGELAEGGATVSVEQAATVMQALQDAIDTVVMAQGTPECPLCGDPVPSARSRCRCLDEYTRATS